MDRRTISEETMGGYVLRNEEWRMDNEEAWVPILAAYNLQGQYIGSSDDATHLCNNLGVLPELADPEHSVCSIGFCHLQQRWYGWSHRAIRGFGVGDVAIEEDLCTESGWEDGVLPDGTVDPLPVPVGFEAKTLDDAKAMARAFAAAVS